MADPIKLNEAAVRKRLVDDTSALTEEIWTVGTSQDEHGNIDRKVVRKLVLLDSTIHPDDFFGEIHTLRPDWPRC